MGVVYCSSFDHTVGNQISVWADLRHHKTASPDLSHAVAVVLSRLYEKIPQGESRDPSLYFPPRSTAFKTLPGKSCIWPHSPARIMKFGFVQVTYFCLWLQLTNLPIGKYAFFFRPVFLWIGHLMDTKREGIHLKTEMYSKSWCGDIVCEESILDCILRSESATFWCPPGHCRCIFLQLFLGCLHSVNQPHKSDGTGFWSYALSRVNLKYFYYSARGVGHSQLLLMSTSFCASQNILIVATVALFAILFTW